MNEKTVSKFSFFNIYLMYSFMTVVLLGAAYFVSHPQIILHNKFGGNESAAYAGLLLLIVPLLYFYFNQKYLLTVSVNDDVIVIKNFFGQRPYFINDIESIDLFARKSLGMLSSRNKSNGISIITCEQTYFLNDRYYRNTPDVKAAIYQSFKPVVINPVEKATDVKSASTQIPDDTGEKFYNNFLFSGDSLTLIVTLILLIWIFNGKDNMRLIITISFITPLYILSFIVKANYFLLSSTQLVVKNQLLWSRKIIFNLSDIQNVIVERHYKQSNTLRVNTRDFRSRVFQSGGLWDSTWKASYSICSQLVLMSATSFDSCFKISIVYDQHHFIQ